MPRRTNHFQKLVTLISGCLATCGTIKESALLYDKTTNIEREVDIVIETEVSDIKVIISIEVVNHKRKVDTGWIEEMKAKHEGLPTNKLVLVSRHGFTKTALSKAKFYGIDTIRLDDALKTDWRWVIDMTTTGSFQIANVSYTIYAFCIHPTKGNIQINGSKNTLVHLPYREDPTDFGNMANFFVYHKDVKDILYRQLSASGENNFTLVYIPQFGTYVVDPDGTKMRLSRFCLVIDVEDTHTPISFASGGYGAREVALGNSTNPDTPLYFVFVRRKDGRDEGILLDKSGLRTLTVTEFKNST